jgi:hypothetical protein
MPIYEDLAMSGKKKFNALFDKKKNKIKTIKMLKTKFKIETNAQPIFAR